MGKIFDYLKGIIVRSYDSSKIIAAHIKKNLREHKSNVIVSLLICLLLLAILWPYIFVTIRSGEAGVYFKRFGGGTVTDKVYGEGFHIVPPWNKMTVYNMRFQTSAHDMDVLTAKGMQVHVKLAIRFKPEYETLAVMHQRVGPDYFKTVIIPDVEATIRKLIGKYDAEELYVTSRDNLQKFTNEAFNSVNDKYLSLDSVLITGIEMPPKIKDAIEKKQEEQQLAEAYVYKIERENKEAQRKVIEAKGIHEANTIIAMSLSEQILRWKGIDASLEVAKSGNSKIVLFGSGKTGLPLLFDSGTGPSAPKGK